MLSSRSSCRAAGPTTRAPRTAAPRPAAARATKLRCYRGPDPDVVGGIVAAAAVADVCADAPRDADADAACTEPHPAVLEPPPARPSDAAAAAAAPRGPQEQRAAQRRAAAARQRADADASNASDLGRLLDVLPPDLRRVLAAHPGRDALVEVVLDLGRLPEARFRGATSELLRTDAATVAEARGEAEGARDPAPAAAALPRPAGRPGAVTRAELDAAVAAVGDFGGDNRAGLPGTLHRVSAVRSRRGEVVGLTCRVGRASPGEAGMVADVLSAGMSVLFLGRPGVGKTTAIRELSRLLADGLGRRVVVVDTSNEVGGDGDVPHASIGSARRMQVPDPEQQHRVMIEAVENHMPQAVVIDEIGTEAECGACRTIAERGVALVATAHGCFLENLLKNPSLADLVGGVQAVTLGDEEAARRGTRKTVLERRGPATFPVVVEMRDRGVWVAHATERSVDALLAGKAPRVQLRTAAAGGGGGSGAGGGGGGPPRVVEVLYDRVDALVAEAVKAQLQAQQQQQQRQQEEAEASAAASGAEAGAPADADGGGGASAAASAAAAAAAAAASAGTSPPPSLLRPRGPSPALAGAGAGEAEEWARRSQVRPGAAAPGPPGSGGGGGGGSGGSIDGLDGDADVLRRYLEGQAGVLRPAQAAPGSGFGPSPGEAGGRAGAAAPKGAAPAGNRRRAR